MFKTGGDSIEGDHNKRLKMFLNQFNIDDETGSEESDEALTEKEREMKRKKRLEEKHQSINLKTITSKDVENSKR